MSIRNTFEHELARLQEQVEEIGRMVECAYQNLFDALAMKDKAAMELVLKNDHNINEMQRQIESQCLKLITRQQPVARDLRVISSVLKMVGDIERVGDHVRDMAELLLRNNLQPISGYSAHLDVMAMATKEVFHDAVDAFVSNSVEGSQKVIKNDDVIDELFNKVKKDIIAGLKSEHSREDEYIDMMMLTKYLEKIGDHAVNVAEWHIFRETGIIA